MNWIVRIFVGLIGLVFLVGLMVALCGYMVYATLRWLLTGRKPQVVLVWQQFRQMRQGGMRWSQAPAGQRTGTPPQSDVVDVEAREVQSHTPRLPDRQG